jgi:hypothetical protein
MFTSPHNNDFISVYVGQQPGVFFFTDLMHVPSSEKIFPPLIHGPGLDRFEFYLRFPYTSRLLLLRDWTQVRFPAAAVRF